MCELFRVLFNFNEVVLQNVHESIENKEIVLSLEGADGEKAAVECQESFFLVDGSYEMKNNLTLQAHDMLTNEDFMFKILGDPLKGTSAN
jgi:hypothetical protein